MEQWRDIPGFGDAYQASSLGRVRSKPGRIHNKVLTQAYNKVHAYPTVAMRVQGKNVTRKVCILVALAWIPNPRHRTEVNHVDRDLLNNRPDNLEWSTYGYVRHYQGRFKEGDAHYRALFTNEEAAEMRAQYETGCSIEELTQLWDANRQTVHQIISHITYKDE